MRKQILSLAVALLIGSTVCMAQNRQNGKADRETYGTDCYRSGLE